MILTPEGAEFFRQHCAGRSGNELMFHRDDGTAWKTSEQARPMKEACEHAKITPRVSFHILRHTWAIHAVMAGVPLIVIAKNLGHKRHSDGREALRPSRNRAMSLKPSMRTRHGSVSLRPPQ